jgi:2-oxoisovalerate dehydrogenase E2 component (dihydrolipoyl transacylase)
MPTNVIMPQLGESVVEGTVSKWLKQEGDSVNEFEPLMEVNTDKVDTEIPSPAAGTLLKLYVPEGTTVKAGTLLAVIGQPGEALPTGGVVSVGHSAAHVTAPTHSLSGPEREGPTPTARRDLGFISPVVAKIADEHKIDLQRVKGTGQGGRITKKDVLDYIETTKAAPALQPAAPAELPPWEKPGEGDLFRPVELQFGSGAPGQLAISTPPSQSSTEQSIPVVGMRKSIAEHMVRSEHTAPHVTTVFEADMSKVLAHLDVHKAQFARDGVNLTLTAYFVSAVVAALKAVPLVNSQWAEDKIILKREVNIGIAVALDEGLIVPVIKNADEKSLLKIARDVNDLAQRARAKALKPDEVVGGTFTITNHGVSGSLFATPIINQPQTGILGVGVMQKRVVVINANGTDSIAIRPLVYVTLTFDHRILDGAVADRFLAKVKETLEGWS